MLKPFLKNKIIAKKATLAQEKKVVKVAILTLECFYLPLMWPENMRKSIEILFNRDIV
ncbi:hypothetical protein HON36_02000 [Candidatus Parcubacteria bacterium]|jgi:hypothetical protein|nr:hypothetical protein [Candidatus Parcubacteria bacterium]MBT7228666.1 hypothetical protein [Candidatus Parcubacteria bacterium]